MLLFSVLIASIRLLFTALAFVAARPVRLGRLSIDLVIFAPVFLMAKPSFAGITKIRNAMLSLLPARQFLVFSRCMGCSTPTFAPLHGAHSEKHRSRRIELSVSWL